MWRSAFVLAFVLSLRAAGRPTGRHPSPRTGQRLPAVPRAGRRLRPPAAESSDPASSRR